MNALKTIVMLLFLGGVGYVVYLSITKSPRRPHEPTTAAVWPTTPKSQLPAPGGLMPRIGGELGEPHSPPLDGASGPAGLPAATNPTAPAHPAAGTPIDSAGMPGLSPSPDLPNATSPNSPDQPTVRTLPPRPNAAGGTPAYGAPAYNALATGAQPAAAAAVPSSAPAAAPYDTPRVGSAAQDAYAPPMPAPAISNVNDPAVPRAPVASGEWNSAGANPVRNDAAMPEPWNRSPAENNNAAGSHAATPAVSAYDRLQPAAAPAQPASPAAPSARDPLQWAGDAGGPAPAPPANANGAANAAQGDAELIAQFRAIMETIRQRLDEGKLDEGLRTLTQLYEMPSLPEQQRMEVVDLMGQVAGTVIYSKQSIAMAPHRVEPGESLEMIAARYQLTPELLMKINGLPDRSGVRPGDLLKVLPGPFSAVVSLERRELVLYVGGMYAGRFPIGIGRDQPRLEGVYGVRDKVRMPAYVGPDQVSIPPGDPRNPLGRAALDLGNGVALHGCDSPSAVGRDDNRGTICLGERDLADLFDILTIGSKVTIQR